MSQHRALLPRPSPPKVPCAIYTRKSTEEGLEQEFNSLDAQREAAEAFIASQKHEGWTCLPERYDDGGFTGGNMERPALQRLLADIRAGRVQVVLVYKVDRLSRSLLDFAKMMETFKKYQVSFVSVTQQFNTATSMGRLVLNVLLSFAQFEREIISERTRDKIAAARRKGKWSGGMPLLGYDVPVPGAKLVVNDQEAARVREIFALYLKKRSLRLVLEELARRAWRTKSWRTRKGQERGGKPFTKSTLHYLLTNVAYWGQIRYRQEVHGGEHAPIIRPETWQRVQRLLANQDPAPGRKRHGSSDALLRGLLRCRACGCAMTPAHSYAHGRKYRYYVCVQAQKRGAAQCPARFLPAGPVEDYVLMQLRRLGQQPALWQEHLAHARQQERRRQVDLETQQLTGQTQMLLWQEEIRQLGRQAGQEEDGTPLLGRLANRQEQFRHLEQRLAEVQEEILALRRSEIDQADLMRALRYFGESWPTLAAAEKAQLLRQMLECVHCEGVDRQVSLTLHAEGIKTLANLQELKP